MPTHRISSSPCPRRPDRFFQARTGLAALLVALAGVVSGAHAQLVVGDAAAGGNAQILLYDLSGANPPRVLVSGIQINSIAADEATQTLYFATSSTPRTLYKAPYTTSGMLVPEVIGTLAFNATGMAWDSVDNQLITQSNSTPVSIYSIDPTTAAMTSVFPRPVAPDPRSDFLFQGLDFSPSENAFYGITFASGGQPTGPASPARAIFRITKPWTNPTYTLVTQYPTTFTGMTAVTVGNGRAFVIGSATTQGFLVVNLAANVYENLLSPIANATNGLGNAGSAWAPGLIAPPAGTDIGVSVGASQACEVAPGGTMVFSARVDNHGAAASGPVVLTVDLPPAAVATFLSSTPPPTTSSATQLVYALPPVPGYGAAAFTDVKILMTAVTPAATASISASATTTSDINPLNNSSSISTSVKPVAPTVAKIKGILSNNRALANSLVPDGGGLRFADFANPAASPSGNYWAMSGNTGAATTATRNVIVRGGTASSPTTLLKRNTTQIGGATIASFDSGIAVNDAGRVVFSADDTGPTTSDESVQTTSDGVSFTEIAREGQPIPAIPSLTYGSTSRNVRILNNGQVGFMTNASDGTDLLLADSGNTVIAKEGVTVPTGAPAAISDINGSVSTNLQGLGFDVTGTHYVYSANLGTGSAATSQIVVSDGIMLMQRGTPLAPSTLPANNFYNDQILRIGPDGLWLLQDRSSSTRVGPDQVIMGVGTTGTRVIKTGDPITPGALEHWSDAPVSDTIFGLPTSFNAADTFHTMEPGPGNHFIIGGFTDAEDPQESNVLVYDGLAVIARSNDPVDLDGNGVFDDDMYIRNFVRTGAVSEFEGVVAFTNDNAALIVVSLRDGKSALCDLNNTQTYYALVRIPLPAKGACCTGTSCSVGIQAACAGAYQGDDSVCGPAGNPTTCCPANYNGINGVDLLDIFAFLGHWFAGNTQADFNHANGVDLLDIFAFLNAWFSGC